MKHIPVIFSLLAYTPYIIPMTTMLHTASPHIITVFIKPYYVFNSPDAHKKLKKPGAITRTLLKHSLRGPQQGIYATYAGFVTHSDINGQISFPRKHEQEEITYVLTQKIKPVIIKGNTVNYFVATSADETAFFSLKRLSDAQKNLYYWRVKRIETPTNKRIPVFALQFFVKPHHLFIEEGDFVTENSPHLFLPPIYTTKALTAGANALLFLKVSKFFSPIKFAYNYTTERYATLIKQ